MCTRRFRAALLALSLLTVAGCRGGHAPAAQGESGEKQYPVEGRVMGINTESGEVELDAKAIPGFMDAMTMPYKLKDPAVLGELHPGDTIRATLVVGSSGAELDKIVIIGQSKPVAKPTSQLSPPIPGAPVPDFALRNQDGKLVHLRQYRGRVLLLTFVYTRCPLADYCPRMSRNFARADKELAADKDLYAHTHLLTISFDPAHDTPAALKSYGGAYTGNYTRETFQHWEFAAPTDKDLQPVLNFFDVARTPESDGTLTHSLSTAVIAPDGRVAKWYGGNDWTPEQLVNDARATLKAPNA